MEGDDEPTPAFPWSMPLLPSLDASSPAFPFTGWSGGASLRSSALSAALQPHTLSQTHSACVVASSPRFYARRASSVASSVSSESQPELPSSSPHTTSTAGSVAGVKRVRNVSDRCSDAGSCSSLLARGSSGDDASTGSDATSTTSTGGGGTHARLRRAQRAINRTHKRARGADLNAASGGVDVEDDLMAALSVGRPDLKLTEVNTRANASVGPPDLDSASVGDVESIGGSSRDYDSSSPFETSTVGSDSETGEGGGRSTFRVDAKALNIDGFFIKNRRKGATPALPLSVAATVAATVAPEGAVSSRAAGAGKRVRWADEHAAPTPVAEPTDAFRLPEPVGVAPGSPSATTPTPTAGVPRPLVQYLGMPFFDADVPISVASHRHTQALDATMGTAGAAATPSAASSDAPHGIMRRAIHVYTHAGGSSGDAMEEVDEEGVVDV